MLDGATQFVATTGLALGQVDFFSELWTAAKGAGPFSTLLLLAVLWAVNNERKTERERNDLLVERLHKVATDATDAIRDLRDTFWKAGDKK